jgi:hypothetical protein
VCCRFQELSYTLQWSDARLWTAQCAGVLAPRLAATGSGKVVAPSFFSMDKLTSRSEELRDRSISRQSGYWIPRIDLASLAPGVDVFDETVDFHSSHGARIPWRSVPSTH